MPVSPRNRLPPSKRQYVAQPMPGFLDFQHPKLVTEPPSGAHWIHEIKFDGYRMQVRAERGVATIYTRNGHDWTKQLPELAEAAADLGQDIILDGELCYLDARGQPTFSGLRSAIGKRKTAGLVYYVFDILWRGDTSLRTFPLKDRKEILAGVLVDAGPEIRMVEPLPGSGAALLQAACQMDLEGIVSKRRDAKYSPGKGDAWVKSKCRQAQEFVIGGWTQEPGRAFKGVLVGVYEGSKLRYVGSLERGFAKTPGLLKRLEALAVDENPFGLASPRKTRDVHWVRPELVGQAEFQEWTASGAIRHASFKGLREDKAANEVVRERPADTPL